MRVLVDTNVLLRLDDKVHPQHGDALMATEKLTTAGMNCVLVPQVLYEYWVVATRPRDVNGLGLEIAQVDRILSEWVRILPVLLDERGVFTHWRALVSTHAVKGKNAHDARLVAAMQRHGLTRILTFNKAHFVRYDFITPLAPTEVLAGTSA